MDFFQDFFWSAQFWFVLGIVFLIAEVLTVTFYFLFFGIGALVTALGVKLGFVDALWAQFLVFSIVSIGATIAFRKLAISMLGDSEKKPTYLGDFVGERATVVKLIQPNLPGKVSYRGTEWAAESTEQLLPGTPVMIKEVQGMVLLVEA
jgi:membrane protein implicated in regulation of membrane protease activity